MIIEVGEKLHVITRKLFDADVRRHFVGQVTAVTGALVRIEGYVFIFDQNRNEYLRKPEKRTRVFAIVDSNLIVNIISPATIIDDVRYVIDKTKGLIATDHKTFTLDINEFGMRR